MPTHREIVNQKSKLLVIFGVLFSSLLWIGCGPAQPIQDDAVSTKTQALHGNRAAIPFRYADTGADLPHGIAGDRRYVFVTKPLVQKVSVLSRLTGRHITDLPAPPGGFLLPFTLRIPSPGKLVVMDSGGFPSATSFAVPFILEYSYKRNAQTGQFEAQLVRNVRVDSVLIGFAEDAEVLPNGDIVLSDSVFGGLWLIKSDGSVAPAITPASLAPQDAIPALAGCLLADGIVIDGVPFDSFGDFAPGVGSITSRDGFLYFSGTCQGGVRKVATSVFYDGRPAHQRAADIQVVSPRPANLNAETLKGLTFNRFNPSDSRLYVADPFRLQIQRIDVQTGQREHLAQSARLFNFTVAMAFLPPLIPGVHVLVASSDQEHRFTGINALLTEDIFVTPFLLTKVIIRR